MKRVTLAVLRLRYTQARDELHSAQAAMAEYRAQRKAAWFANLPIPTNGAQVFERLTQAEIRYNAYRYVYVNACDDAIRRRVELADARRARA